MGRNIDLDDMIDTLQVECPKCFHRNVREFEEFDIDCYEFKNGVCEYEFECENCTYKNKATITIDIQIEDK